RGEKIVLDLADRAVRLQHAEVEHRVDLDRNVVAGDHVLRRNVHRDGAEIDPHELLDERYNVRDAGAARLDHAAEAEDDGALVFAKDLDAADKQHDDDDKNRD